MVDIFTESSFNPIVSHVHFNDIAEEKIKKWRAIAERSGIILQANRFATRITSAVLEDLINEHRDLLAIATSIIQQQMLAIPKPHLFFLTDHNGCILELYGLHEVVNKLEEINFGKGTSMVLEHAGINGVSLAMQLRQPVVIQGEQHDLVLLSKWSCLCVPIRKSDDVIAYLDLSVHADDDVTYAMPLILNIAASSNFILIMKLTSIEN